ncbi:MAG: sporulation transcriptional regulator SpoIIID, partial [Bacilli bacterium]
NETVREIALKFNVSKSTVHKDLVERLKKIDKKKYAKVKCIMDYHLKIRHIKGGEATKLKYKAR